MSKINKRISNGRTTKKRQIEGKRTILMREDGGRKMNEERKVKDVTNDKEIRKIGTSKGIIIMRERR